jgi:Plasmid pRiA4b ORF-3-like protein
MSVSSKSSRPTRAAAEAKSATARGTLLFRATLPGRPSVYRDIEVDSRKSLHDLAAAIVRSFDFDFDHAFGFYSGKTRQTLMTALPKYELFADKGEPTEGALGVKRTKIATAFPTIGHVMTFLFDYGDDWLFKVELRAAGEKVAGLRYPRTVAKHGDAPEQYPALDDDDS